MSGSLSAVQMGALPGLKYATVGLSDDDKAHGIHARTVEEANDARKGIGSQTGSPYQEWAGGDTQASLRAGNLSTQSKNMSFAQQKGKIPMSASKGTLGSLLYAADEGFSELTAPSAVGTQFQKER